MKIEGNDSSSQFVERNQKFTELTIVKKKTCANAGAGS